MWLVIRLKFAAVHDLQWVGAAPAQQHMALSMSVSRYGHRALYYPSPVLPVRSILIHPF